MTYKSDVEKAHRGHDIPEFPSVVLIDNTSACNLSCSMCDHANIKRYRPIQNMPIALYRKIIDEVAEENPSARVWEIFFGDPFLCIDMPERIAYAKGRGLKDVVVNSNGILMTPDRAREYIVSGLDAMYVGIDAANEPTYNKIRMGGDFHQAVANVLAYRDILQEHGVPGQKLFVQFVVNEHNEDEVETFRDFWRINGVNVKIRPKISWAGLVKAANLRKNEDAVRHPCYWLMQAVNICADGRVALCSVDLHCRVDCGSVERQRIKEIWRSGPLAKYRRLQKAGNYGELPDMCRDCRDWQSAYAEYALA